MLGGSCGGQKFSRVSSIGISYGRLKSRLTFENISENGCICARVHAAAAVAAQFSKVSFSPRLPD